MIDVTLWADVRCPWCWIGLRRLQAAADKIPGGLRVQHRSFLLEPDGPSDPGRAVADVAVAEWGMDARQWQERSAFIRAEGLREGLDINIDDAKTVDSRLVHRLLKLAAARGVAPAAAWEEAFDAHLRRNVDLGDPEIITDLAARIGLDDARTRALLDGTDFADDVMADHKEATHRGIHAVPTVVVADHVLSGSHSAAELAEFITHAGGAR